MTDAVVAGHLADIAHRLGEIERHQLDQAERLARVEGLSEDTNELARATNGRVTELERRDLERDAIERTRRDERAKAAAKAAARATASELRREQRRRWVIPFATGALVAAFGATFTWALAHFLG